MSYAILRTSKLKTFGNISSSLKHTYRVKGFAPNADPKLISKNKTLVGNRNDPLADVRNRIDQIDGKIRSNAVLAVEHLLTASPDFFVKKTAKEIDLWAKKNIQWLEKTYGKDNVVHAALHMDESTPHIAAYIVPEKDGKLNCREFLGGREKLKDLQTSYATAMKPFKLERGIEGSKSRHNSVKNFYANLNKVEKSAAQELKKVSKPVDYPEPSIRSVISKQHRESERKDWEKRDRSQKLNLVKTAGKAVLSAKDANKQVRELKQENSSLMGEIELLKDRLTQAYEQLELPKDEINKLRKLDISQVAERLGFFDPVKKNENAIDLVKRVNGFDYQQSIAWLNAEFGSAGAAAAVRENLEIKKPERPFSKSENAIKQVINTQLDALGCDSYRISLIAPDGAGAPYLPGKSSTEEKFYSKSDIINLIPYLRYENNVEKRHIYITPMDDHAYYILLDDMGVKKDEFLATGYKPCLIQDTSWQSSQAIIKVPKADIDRRDVIDFFNSINREIGDKSITGLRHPFRLAGFRNMKPKHEKDGKYPFVKLTYAVNQFCRKTYELIKNIGREKQDIIDSPKFKAPKF